jgi:hypothetical protein
MGLISSMTEEEFKKMQEEERLERYGWWLTIGLTVGIMSWMVWSSRQQVARFVSS